ncbi:Mu transposase C-terminal domain-containing protein [Streptomyces justiciae]|uniref:Mu transposase C-terminal domain-containing protein n=1 Tax=Streptomyces justiciae TaxID=2780140 RepID=UPI002119300F|nr:Mu transposase C-terminal domain-containing protein [Streptomyces justiciae]MCW8384535.1 Mu transposase C-terminal domain-containing protein [Streptomyces justiciae]
MTGLSGGWRVEVGAHVVFDGVTWQIAALVGQTVRLVDEAGTTASVLAAHMCADPGFRVITDRVRPEVPQWGLFEGVEVQARERALAWQRHIREVESGLPDGPGGKGVPRPRFDLKRWSLAEREQAKAEELTALGWTQVSVATVRRMRARYRRQGLLGLVDGRARRACSPTGRSDERVVAAVLEALRRQRGRSKGTLRGLRELTGQVLEEVHGVGVVAVPPESTFNRLVKALADPRELPGRPARTATVPVGPFTPTRALRPGEMVQVDTTRLDVVAIDGHGRVARPELTIALDVATRSILAAVLRPEGTKAVDAALLLAEMAVPHPMRPGWETALELAYAAVPYERLLSLDHRFAGAAARPVVVPETIVVDRGKVFVSEGFLAASETLGVSVQPAPPRQPTAKGSVERTFGAINTLFAQHVAGYTGSNVTRRGRNVEAEASWTLTQLQELLDEWIVCGWQSRRHAALRHPMLPRAALSPNEMWAALLGVCGYVPLALTGRDYLELLPVRWQAVTGRGIRISHRTYDHAVLNEHRGQASGVTARGGKWEVHHNPHDLRQVWVRLPDGQLAEVPWIHREHVHEPFGESAWRHVKTLVEQRGGREQHEADLAAVLDQVLRRARTGKASAAHPVERAVPLSPAVPGQRGAQGRSGRKAAPGAAQGERRGKDGAALLGTPADTDAGQPSFPGGWAQSMQDGTGWEEGDSLDDLDGGDGPDASAGDGCADGFAGTGGGFDLYDAYREAEQW